MNRSDQAVALAAGVGAGLAWRAYRARRDFDFRNKVVLVTGGTRGLGLVMARQLAAEGAWLAVCARDGEEVARARAELSARGARVLAGTCDLTDPREARELVDTVEAFYGKLDVLINNAGTITVGPIDTMTLGDFQSEMASNFYTAVHTTLAALPGMRRRGAGRIVNITSIGGKVSVPHLIPYCASKFALVGFSEGLRSELARHGIVVTTVCPGLMRTGSPRNAFFKGQHRREYAWFAIGDSLPLVTVSAGRAARKVIEACRRGDGEIVIGWPYKLATVMHDLFPGLTADVAGVVNRLLPRPGGVGTRRMRGFQSESAAAPSFATALSESAARENNGIFQPAAAGGRPAPPAEHQRS